MQEKSSFASDMKALSESIKNSIFSQLFPGKENAAPKVKENISSISNSAKYQGLALTSKNSITLFNDKHPNVTCQTGNNIDDKLPPRPREDSSLVEKTNLPEVISTCPPPKFTAYKPLSTD